MRVDTDLATVQAQLAALDDRVDRNQEGVMTRLELALENHRQLHEAHSHAHDQEHDMQRAAVAQNHITVREMAELHAHAHEREHIMSNEALDKAENANQVRFEHLNEARARAADERANFATKETVDDKTSAIINRLDVLDKQHAIVAERASIIATNTARIAVLENTDTLAKGRDSGIGQSWGVLVAVGTIALAVGGLLVNVLSRGTP